jgi:hypothetical protein
LLETEETTILGKEDFPIAAVRGNFDAGPPDLLPSSEMRPRRAALVEEPIVAPAWPTGVKGKGFFPKHAVFDGATRNVRWIRER